VLHELFRTALEAMGAPVVDVRGSWATRAKTAKDAINALFAAPADP
jgi:nicotinamide riboside kinase